MNIGDTYQGGVVFYVDETGENGLISALNDIDINYWSLINSETGATDNRIGAGKLNTSTIVSALGSGSYAVKLCDDIIIEGLDDWYLPSLQELQLMLFHYSIINGGNYLTRWSSTEASATHAYGVPFDQALDQPVLLLEKTKFSDRRVSRPIRTFGSFDPFDISLLNLPSKATIETVSATVEGSSRVSVRINVSDDGGAAIASKGVLISKLPNPYFGESHVSDNTDLGIDDIAINGLESGTTYYVIGYAVNAAGIKYGSELTFTTDEVVIPEPPAVSLRNPDKHIRKAIYDLINNMVVSGNTIPCFDMRVPGTTNPMYYVLLESQTKAPTNKSKCGYQWDCMITIDVITKYDTGNAGSRVLLNDIEEKILELMEGFTMTDLFSIEFDGSQSLDSTTDSEVMFRELIRYRIIINK